MIALCFQYPSYSANSSLVKLMSPTRREEEFWASGRAATLLAPLRPSLDLFSMVLKALIALTLASLAATSLALPATPQAPLIGNARQAALNWGTGAVSRVGDGGVHTVTRWEWNDCGTSTLSCCSVAVAKEARHLGFPG